MANSPASVVIQHLRNTMLRPDGAGLTDGQLLQEYIDRRQERAFDALVRRHGSMVYGVCRRMLGHAHDAEDAFQATFLVLARKAASIVPAEAVGNWLYGVAYHTALKARAVASRRRAREKQVKVMPEPHALCDDPWHDVLPLLDRELNRLPDRYRLPAVLCDLEGRSRREAARQLKIPEGTLSSRLTTARRLLARRLRQHGVAPAAGALASAALIAQSATAACVPNTLIVSTVQAATLFAAGKAAALSSAPVAALAEGVLKSMFLSKLKFATTFVLAACLAALACWPVFRTVAAGSDVADETREHLTVRLPVAPAEANAQAEQADNPQRIRGSGKVISKDLDLADFTAVEVNSVFQIAITQAAKFRTTVSADDNVLPYVKATREGSTLRLSIDSKNKSLSSTTLKATIAMPVLERVDASGAVQVQCHGFKSAKSFKANITNASRLTGEIDAGKVDLRVAGGSKIILKGSAREARISGSQAGSLFLGDLALDRADVTLKEASSATVNVKGQLDYDLSLASRLEYRGDPAIGKHQATGASKASRASSDLGKGQE
jgi:RNA polymerase sigma factor (sigma-70 family)